MTNNTSHYMWYLIGGVTILGSLIAWKYYKRNKKSNSSGSVLINVIPDIEIKKHFIPILMHFSGSLNALTDIIRDDEDIESAETIFRNIELIITGHGDDEIKKWYFDTLHARKSWTASLYKDKAKLIQNILISCGITASTEVKLTWDTNAAKHYRKLFKIEDGQVCDVIAPCWIYQNQVFEQGIVKASTIN